MRTLEIGEYFSTPLDPPSSKKKIEFLLTDCRTFDLFRHKQPNCHSFSVNVMAFPEVTLSCKLRLFQSRFILFHGAVVTEVKGYFDTVMRTVLPPHLQRLPQRLMKQLRSSYIWYTEGAEVREGLEKKTSVIRWET